ncbi:MAG TPA: peptidylprolyl isomerase [Chitinophagaceae bacterium]|nr:peptidylprolyl isomerase [Chitinophagaceae bacterium]
MKKVLFLCLLSATGSYSAFAQKPKPAPAAPGKPVLTNSIDSFSYAVGLSVAGSLQEQGVGKVNTQLIARGINEALANQKTLLTKEQANMTLQQKLQEYAKNKVNAEKARGAAYMEQNKKRKEVVSLPNGLQYEVMQSGEAGGPKPTAKDTVVVHYTGTLVDGTVFDSSVQRGEPATFPVGGVIQGWTKILQLMTKGDKWKVVIPSELGYGDNGAGHTIKPGATLIFEINLIDIKPAQ